MKTIKTITKYFQTPASLEETLKALHQQIEPVERQFVFNKYISFDLDSAAATGFDSGKEAPLVVKVIGYWVNDHVVEVACATKNGRTSAVLRAEMTRTRLGGTEIYTETPRNFGFIFFELLFALSSIGIIIYWVYLNNEINPSPNLRIINDGLILALALTTSSGFLTWAGEFGSYATVHAFIDEVLRNLRPAPSQGIAPTTNPSASAPETAACAEKISPVEPDTL